ncbi:CshA/CshB family fibrillar adhesin-related protein [Flavobacterium sp. NKUCC04_CG]|uniref:CshA/CshB family fibrillar adhesin-related protein n=1 Tax=Flavobacterium sp. NKUCC04_CG TaxID=2842121 RepID=UPI001C5BE307|nr:CshA/CshB family fibrillar adhesin-related protein [Flavobacterium sp. NKUCC04_CG]MBW3520465.1 hypothetical protein [Flavobacterium sp. NKUCC04_CG]
MDYRNFIFGLVFLLTIISQPIKAQCFSNGFATAAFATGGSSPNTKDVLWLTWGASSSRDTYGKANVTLNNNSTSYASIPIAGGKFLCIEAKLIKVVGNIQSYRPGNYTGDSLDKLYNIGGIGARNKLVCGIKNGVSGKFVSFSLVCKAYIDGVPARLTGVVIADAESLSDIENFYAIGSGSWTLIDLLKNTSSREPYVIRKDNINSNQQKISFLRGNDDRTGGVTFLTFNDQAYDKKDLSVTVDVGLRGGGVTAIALGLLVPKTDTGDAPESYGVPLHVFNALEPIDDQIAVGQNKNINIGDYKLSGLRTAVGGYLGSVPPDGDINMLFGKLAMGDDLDGYAGSKEEDAWPQEYRSFSYKAHYLPGYKMKVVIPYHTKKNGYITGWIDFNLDGKFSDDEKAIVNAPISAKTATLEWTVPKNRIARSTYVRLRFGYTKSEIDSPIGAAIGGEVEDTRIIIQGRAIVNPVISPKIK